MAKTDYVYLIPDLEDQYFASLRTADRFEYTRMTRKVVFFSRKRRKGMTQKSLLPQIAVLWATLSSGQKQAWSDAGAESNKNGWRLFVQDMCARFKNDIAGIATPSLLHQSWVGKLTIEAPASEIKIVQIHPHFYWISKKVRGVKGMRYPVQITEDLALPFTLGVNYKSNLSAVGSPAFAKIYARFWHSYQGQDLVTDLEIPFDAVKDWTHVEDTLTTLSGYVVRYDIYFHIQNMTGVLYFDNVEATHSAQNWVRNPFCKDINQGFTRMFYQVPKHWAAVVLPETSWYDSVYEDF